MLNMQEKQEYRNSMPKPTTPSLIKIVQETRPETRRSHHLTPKQENISTGFKIGIFFVVITITAAVLAIICFFINKKEEDLYTELGSGQ